MARFREKYVKLIVAAGVCVTMLMPLSASAWYDPMRPQGSGVTTDNQAEKPVTLSSIVMAGQRRVAVLDGKVVTVGDLINGYLVENISAQHVDLKKGDQHYRLQLAAAQQASSIKRKITE